MKNAVCWMVVLGVLLFGSNALAQGNSQGHGKGNPHNAHWDDDDQGDHDRDGGHWKARNGWEYQTYEGDRRPPGWGNGKKKGWGNCDLPPGQAKKYGCNTYSYGGREYHWYRDDVGRIVVRRPIISAHAGIEIH